MILDNDMLSGIMYVVFLGANICFLLIIDHQTTFLKDRIKTNNGF